MRKLIVALSLAVISVPTFALEFGSSSTGGAGGTGGAATGGTATGGAGGASTADGGSATGGTGGASAACNDDACKARAQVGDSSLNNSSTFNTVIPEHSTQTIKLKNTPDVNIGGPASGPCNGFSATLGVSLPGIGLGGGMSRVDQGCAERETARIAGLLGRMDIANAILENNPIVLAALKAKADRERPTPVQVTPVVTSASDVNDVTLVVP